MPRPGSRPSCSSCTTVPIRGARRVLTAWTTGSETRRRLVAAFDQFHDVALAQATAKWRSCCFDLDVDIAVDLKGHTQHGGRRFWLIARRRWQVSLTFGYIPAKKNDGRWISIRD